MHLLDLLPLEKPLNYTIKPMIGNLFIETLIVFLRKNQIN